MRIAVLILLLFLVSLSTLAQKESVTGFILKSLETETNTYYDFFLLAKLDSTKNLKDNLIQLKNDTLIRINISNSVFENTLYIINEANKNERINIIPIKGIWSDWILEDYFLHSNGFIQFPIQVGGQIIVEGFNPRRICSFKQLTILKLKSDER